jgi:transcriptional regulator with XRE-family HTH domain
LALADFLRNRRAHISPAAAGVPARARRRAAGLRREEVADLANASVAWYVSMEQGRDVHPSVQVLENVAKALSLSPEERRHLFLLAEKQMPASSTSHDQEISPELKRAVLNLDPHPAFVLGYRWDIVAWNRAADYMYGISNVTPPYARNRIWRVFAHLDDRIRLPGWEQYARGMLAEFRADAARHAGDPAFEELIGDLMQSSPYFREWWPHHDVHNVLERHKVIQHAELGTLEFELLTFQIPDDPDMKLMLYSAAPATAEKLRRRISSSTAKAPPRTKSTPIRAGARVSRP